MHIVVVIGQVALPGISKCRGCGTISCFLDASDMHSCCCSCTRTCPSPRISCTAWDIASQRACLSCPEAIWSRLFTSTPEQLDSTWQSLDAADMAAWASGRGGGWQTLAADHRFSRTPGGSFRSGQERGETKDEQGTRAVSTVPRCALCRLRATVNCDRRAWSGDAE